jgi:ATP-dependent Zn protease
MNVVSVEDLEKNIIHETVSEIIQGEETKTVSLLQENEILLKRMVDLLQKNESLVAEEIQDLIRGRECA